MELYKLPYIKRMLATQESRAVFVASFLRLNDRNSSKAAAIIGKVITAYNSVTAKLGSLEANPANADEAADLAMVKAQISSLIADCRVALYGKENCFPWVVIAVKFERVLGTARRLSYLRNLISNIQAYSDSEEAMDWLKSQVAISYCDNCEGWEYDVKMVPAYGSSMDEELVCRSCVENYYRWSEYYERYVHENYIRSARDANGNHVTCHEDDDDFTYDEDNDYYYHVDYDPPPPPIIASYHSSKSSHRPIIDDWSKSKHRWFGVELEVEIKDGNVAADDKARQLNEIINEGDVGKRVFFERDGSLSNGFEIITQPMSLPSHRDMWSWLRDREAIRNLLSHNTRTCGLHVHINRDALSQIQIAKMVTFVNDPRNESMIRAIARRYAEGYCKIKEKKLESAHQSTDRYEALNITGSRTVEFRIFKGSLKYESVIAAIEFCNALVDYAAQPDTNDVTKLSSDYFIDFINNVAVEETTTLRPYINAVLQTA